MYVQHLVGRSQAGIILPILKVNQTSDLLWEYPFSIRPRIVRTNARTALCRIEQERTAQHLVARVPHPMRPPAASGNWRGARLFGLSADSAPKL